MSVIIVAFLIQVFVKNSSVGWSLCLQKRSLPCKSNAKQWMFQRLALVFLYRAYCLQNISYCSSNVLQEWPCLDSKGMRNRSHLYSDKVFFYYCFAGSVLASGTFKLTSLHCHRGMFDHSETSAKAREKNILRLKETWRWVHAMTSTWRSHVQEAWTLLSSFRRICDRLRFAWFWLHA